MRTADWESISSNRWKPFSGIIFPQSGPRPSSFLTSLIPSCAFRFHFYLWYYLHCHISYPLARRFSSSNLLYLDAKLVKLAGIGNIRNRCTRFTAKPVHPRTGCHPPSQPPQQKRILNFPLNYIQSPPSGQLHEHHNQSNQYDHGITTFFRGRSNSHHSKHIKLIPSQAPNLWPLVDHQSVSPNITR
jgi:hypothetical protein